MHRIAWAAARRGSDAAAAAPRSRGRRGRRPAAGGAPFAVAAAVCAGRSHTDDTAHTSRGLGCEWVGEEASSRKVSRNKADCARLLMVNRRWPALTTRQQLLWSVVHCNPPLFPSLALCYVLHSWSVDVSHRPCSPAIRQVLRRLRVIFQ
jgi:hypothetical protein